MARSKHPAKQAAKPTKEEKLQEITPDAHTTPVETIDKTYNETIDLGDGSGNNAMFQRDLLNFIKDNPGAVEFKDIDDGKGGKRHAVVTKGGHTYLTDNDLRAFLGEEGGKETPSDIQKDGPAEGDSEPKEKHHKKSLKEKIMYAMHPFSGIDVLDAESGEKYNEPGWFEQALQQGKELNQRQKEWEDDRYGAEGSSLRMAHDREMQSGMTAVAHLLANRFNSNPFAQDYSSVKDDLKQATTYDQQYMNLLNDEEKDFAKRMDSDLSSIDKERNEINTMSGNYGAFAKDVFSQLTSGTYDEIQKMANNINHLSPGDRVKFRKLVQQYSDTYNALNNFGSKNEAIKAEILGDKSLSDSQFKDVLVAMQENKVAEMLNKYRKEDGSYDLAAISNEFPKSAPGTGKLKGNIGLMEDIKALAYQPEGIKGSQKTGGEYGVLDERVSQSVLDLIQERMMDPTEKAMILYQELRELAPQSQEAQSLLAKMDSGKPLSKVEEMEAMRMAEQDIFKKMQDFGVKLHAGVLENAKAPSISSSSYSSTTMGNATPSYKEINIDELRQNALSQLTDEDIKRLNAGEDIKCGNLSREVSVAYYGTDQSSNQAWDLADSKAGVAQLMHNNYASTYSIHGNVPKQYMNKNSGGVWAPKSVIGSIAGDLENFIKSHDENQLCSQNIQMGVNHNGSISLNTKFFLRGAAVNSFLNAECAKLRGLDAFKSWSYDQIKEMIKESFFTGHGKGDIGGFKMGGKSIKDTQLYSVEASRTINEGAVQFWKNKKKETGEIYGVKEKPTKRDRGITTGEIISGSRGGRRKR